MSDTSNQNVETSNTPNINHVTGDDIRGLLNYFAKNTYSARTENEETKSFLEKSISLMKLDYGLILVQNNNGELCSHYPSQIPILEYENGSNQHLTSSQRTTDTIYESIHDVQQIREQFNRAKFARCRARFAVPVIFYKGKYICRSATLSGGAEIYGRHGMEYLSEYLLPSGETPSEPSVEDEDEPSEPEAPTSQSDWQLFDKVRNQDIKLLKKLNVGTIVDLMVENKKVKYGMYVTSSEKVDKENRYSDFNIISFPYPGCEFFKDFGINGLSAKGLVFNWSQEMCDATLNVPDNPLLAQLKVDWDNYKDWDIPTMTRHYMKYILKYFQDNSSGLLVHCISGWDRTPLYISMLRLSLWADGLIHQSLDEYQILYLTIAYDWILFGHHLSDRLRKGEHIFFFCFYMMKYLAHQEYSIAPGRHKRKLTDRVSDEGISKADSDTPIDYPMESDRGSNVSLNSICSTVSTKSQEPSSLHPHLDETNGSNGHSLDVRDTLALGASTSPQGKRTSPVPVPESKQKRTETSPSASSVHSNHSSQSTHSSTNSCASWQMVTTTGSVRGDSPSVGDRHSSMSTLIDMEDYDLPMPLPNRYDRLTKIREYFYNAYFHVIGYDNVRCAPDNLIESVISNLAEKVGLSQRT